ncbi:MAG: hypothetical protein CVT98_07055 [Bacteroidetes bacterium HGW-Bacteroidetes-15]|nr:MAG: hypothetical protein CVT98_07055 [Bacteroidetes bacterium HGW-Bacteroidetes-15]
MVLAKNDKLYDNNEHPTSLDLKYSYWNDLRNKSSVTSVEGREYHFFDDNVFECDLFKSFVKEEDLLFLNNNPILRAYFIMIYPATTWLDDESLYILEIL